MRRLLPVLFSSLALAKGAQPADFDPSTVLGITLGADRTLADWNQAREYLRVLAASSPRVLVQEVGKTTEGRPFLVVTISSEANMARLEEIRRANLRLSDPRGLADGDAGRLVGDGKVIVVLAHGIHSDEVASTQTALETAYWLATSRDETVARILEETVVVMIPCENPDGMQRVTEWYRRTLATPFEGEDPPFLYHHYVGHDNNRDWYMFTQEETRLVVSNVFEKWRPQIVHDLHQMGRATARIFVPPYLDPWEPNVDPALVSLTNAIGAHVAAALTAEGKAGVATHAIYDAWSPSRSYPTTHGGVRILSECASPRLATPVDLEFRDLQAGLGYDPRKASWNFPDPWPGGHWRLRDVMDYQLSATRAVLDYASAHREMWLRSFLEVNRRASKRQRPFAFVIPREQRDPLATARLLLVLRTAGVEVQRSSAAFDAGGQAFDAGSHVVRLAQPASSFAKAVLEVQHYPDVRTSPGEPPQRPYDVTAHTLPLLMGVDVRTVEEPFSFAPSSDAGLPIESGRIEGSGARLALGHSTGDLIALGRLLRQRVEVRWAQKAFSDRGRRFEAGTLVLPASAGKFVEEAVRDTGAVARGIDALPSGLALRRPRLAVYQSFAAPLDEGWTRFVLEQDLGVDYVTVHNADLKKEGLLKRFDAVLLPDEGPKAILEGTPVGKLPDEYTGGLGADGVSNLKRFVEAGGTLIALNNASKLPIESFGLGVRSTLDSQDEPSSGFYAPGSILRVAIDPTEPLGHGLPPTAAVWFDGSVALEGGTPVARYSDPDPLLSGWLLGGERLRGKAALVEARLGKGRVVLFGFRPQYRAQSWGTYTLLLNAIYLSAARPAP